ncbi:MAG: hypothetical protein U0935_15525 [Pirellulales bacterium]
MFSALRNFVAEQDAPTMVEYGLLLALVVLVAVVSVGTFGQAVYSALYSNVIEAFEGRP